LAAQEERYNEHGKRIECHSQSNAGALTLGERHRSLQENKSQSIRVDDRKQRTEAEQEIADPA